MHYRRLLDNQIVPSDCANNDNQKGNADFRDGTPQQDVRSRSESTDQADLIWLRRSGTSTHVNDSDDAASSEQERATLSDPEKRLDMQLFGRLSPHSYISSGEDAINAEAVSICTDELSIVESTDDVAGEDDAECTMSLRKVSKIVLHGRNPVP